MNNKTALTGLCIITSGVLLINSGLSCECYRNRSPEQLEKCAKYNMIQNFTWGIVTLFIGGAVYSHKCTK